MHGFFLALPRSTLLALAALAVVLANAATPTVLATVGSSPMLASRCSRHRPGEVAGGAIVVLGLLLVGEHEDPTASLDTDGESAQEL